MSKCTFFGNRNTSINIKAQLRQIIIDVIENYEVDTFYVGNHGNFDRIVKSVLEEIAEEYPNIEYYIVLAYLPQKGNKIGFDYKNSIYPDGLENVPYRFAITKRNKWMLDNSDVVITHTFYTYGNSAKMRSLAEKKNKKSI